MTTKMQDAILFLKAKAAVVHAQQKHLELAASAIKAVQGLAADILNGEGTELTQRQAGTLDFICWLHIQSGIFSDDYTHALYNWDLEGHWESVGELYGDLEGVGEKMDHMITDTDPYCCRLLRDEKPQHYRHPQMLHRNGADRFPCAGIPPFGKGFPKHCDHCARVAELKANHKERFKLEINCEMLLDA